MEYFGAKLRNRTSLEAEPVLKGQVHTQLRLEVRPFLGLEPSHGVKRPVAIAPE